MTFRPNMFGGDLYHLHEIKNKKNDHDLWSVFIQKRSAMCSKVRISED